MVIKMVKYSERLVDILYEKLIEEEGLLDRIYGYIPEIEDKDYNEKTNQFEITHEKTNKIVSIPWKREVRKNQEYIEFDFPEKIFGYPMRNYKCYDLYSLKKSAKETKARTVQSFLLEIGLMKEELKDAKMICEFDLNKDPRKLTEKELAQFHLIKTRRDF